MFELQSLFQTEYMRWIIFLIMADWLVGIVTALRKKTFKLSMVAHYMHDAVLPFVLVFAAIEVFGRANVDLAFIVPVSFILIAANLIGNVVANLYRLGVPVPKYLRKEKV